MLTSIEEAALITGYPIIEHQDVEAAAKQILEMGPDKVVIKQGAAGALGATEELCIHALPLAVEAIESVGAGDAFNAGFLSGELRGWSLAESLRLGNIMGALATTAPGDIEGLPDWAEVQSYLGGDAQVER